MLTNYRQGRLLYGGTLSYGHLLFYHIVDFHLGLFYPARDKMAYGSVYLHCYYSEMAKLTRARVTELKVWLEGRMEGDVCRGSVKSSGR